MEVRIHAAEHTAELAVLLLDMLAKTAVPELIKNGETQPEQKQA